MSSEVATRTAAIQSWDEGFQRLVTQTVLRPKDRDATAAELALLAEQAVRTGLDPMSRQIYGIYRKTRGVEVMTLQVGIDGLRAIAERTGSYLGQSGPYWCGDDGVWREVWFDTSPPRAAKVVVRKAIGEHIAETPAVAHFDEYAPMKDEWVDGSKTGKRTLSGLWGDKPALMIAKCAEALALRKAFPQDMSGLYTDDEMARADAKAAPFVEIPPAPKVLTAAQRSKVLDAVKATGITDSEWVSYRNALGAATDKALTMDHAHTIRAWLDSRETVSDIPSDIPPLPVTPKGDVPWDEPPEDAGVDLDPRDADQATLAS
jgi:phage recombination protein Bet